MTVDRRTVLRRAAQAGALGSAVTVGLACDSGPASAASAIKAEDVKRHGAAGDGRRDDTEAIRKALAAVPDDGGSVFFPPGDYLVSGQLEPKSQTLIFGCHSPRYEPVANPGSACKLRAAARFDGGGLIAPGGSTQGVTLRNLALAGDGNAPAGLRLPQLRDVTGEQGWTLENLTIAGFETGIAGRAHVFSLVNCHVHANSGWGIDASGGDRWNDSHVVNCFFYFNRAGNLRFAGSEQSAAVEFANCRFERAGNAYGKPSDPLAEGSPGIRLEHARFLSFTNCFTDANTGPGVDVAGDAERVRAISFTGCGFHRDGRAGVSVEGSSGVRFANCVVGVGEADDAGGGPRGPDYGVQLQGSDDFGWTGGAVEGLRERWRLQPPNRRTAIIDPARGFMTLPLERPAIEPFDGLVYLDADAGDVVVRSDSAWRRLPLR